MSKKCAGVVCALLLGVAVTACSPTPAESPPDIRLVELLKAGGASLGGVDGAKPPKMLRWPQSGAGWSGRIQMPELTDHFDNRESVAAPSGGTLRFELHLPPEPVLELGLGYWIPGDLELAPENNRLKFQVSVEGADGARSKVLDETIRAGRKRDWNDRAIDLADWAGQQVAIELTSSGYSSLWAVWGHPMVVNRPTAGERLADRRPNVLLISLDTLRADALGCYGYAAPTSPNIDRLAERSFLFRQAVSQSPWTRPSHEAMMTGFYPSADPSTGRQSIAEVLRRGGYRTLGLTAGGQLHPEFGFARGFDSYRVGNWLLQPEMVTEWWRASDGQPRLLFLHTYEIHDPYTHQELAQGLERGRLGDTYGKRDWERMRLRDEILTEEERIYIRALYDGDIAFTDRQLGLLLDALGEQGLFDDTIVVLTSDHGEQFWEHGSWRHGQALYDHQILVPLIIHLPQRVHQLPGNSSLLSSAEISNQVQLIDLLPTLLDILGFGDLSDWLQGRSLRPLLEGTQVPPVDAFSEHTNVPNYERKAIRTDRFKYMHSYARRRGGRDLEDYVELYDLNLDPAERNNISAERADLVEQFESQLIAFREGVDGTSEAAEQIPEGIDPELRKRLKALGYVEN